MCVCGGRGKGYEGRREGRKDGGLTLFNLTLELVKERLHRGHDLAPNLIEHQVADRLLDAGTWGDGREAPVMASEARPPGLLNGVLVPTAGACRVKFPHSLTHLGLHTLTHTTHFQSILYSVCHSCSNKHTVQTCISLHIHNPHTHYT